MKKLLFIIALTSSIWAFNDGTYPVYKYGFNHPTSCKTTYKHNQKSLNICVMGAVAKKNKFEKLEFSVISESQYYYALELAADGNKEEIIQARKIILGK